VTLCTFVDGTNVSEEPVSYDNNIFYMTNILKNFKDLTEVLLWDMNLERNHCLDITITRYPNSFVIGI
jgi:hypothetical protein